MIAIVALTLAPVASAWRAPTLDEYRRIGAALPAFYHQACIRSTIRISTVNRSYGAVFFRFVKPTSKGCSPFDGQVLVKRVSPIRWAKIGEGSSWPCRLKGVPAGVTKDLFGACGP